MYCCVDGKALGANSAFPCIGDEERCQGAAVVAENEDRGCPREFSDLGGCCSPSEKDACPFFPEIFAVGGGEIPVLLSFRLPGVI